jgi:hypothetical protein
MCYPRIFWLLFLSLFLSIFISCSDDSPKPEEVASLPPVVEKKEAVTDEPKQAEPKVYIEELDQYQEYFKEQHETSFSHVTKKNWTSYTAGKDGILTKIMLFGKPNYTISEHYGSSMSGFVRADNPDTGPKYGEWSITREEIVNQLALQGLTEIDRGWITLQMRGEIPQQAGKMYFLVCDKIADKRAWFGAFAFAEGNSYKKGRFWLHPEHDLVFRTYVGKTADQLELEERGQPLFENETASLIPANDIPAAPKSMIELNQNFEPSPSKPESPQPTESKSNLKGESLYQPATLSPTKIVEEPVIIQKVEDQLIPEQEPANPTESSDEISPSQEKQSGDTTPKRSLFERFFKEKSQ